MQKSDTLKVITQFSCSSVPGFIDAKPAIKSECEKAGYNAEFYETDISGIENLNLSENETVLILCYSEIFLNSVLNAFEKRKIHGIVVGLDAPQSNCSCISFNRAKSIHLLTDYLKQHNKTKTALFGINQNSASDLKRVETFLKCCGEKSLKDIFYKEGSLDLICSCFDFSAYDSVICPNDMTAVVLLRHAALSKVDLKNIFIVGYGNTLLSKHVSPSLTTIGIDYAEAGRIAVRLYEFLKKHADNSYVRIEIKGKLYIRETTNNLPYNPEKNIQKPDENELKLNFLNDKDVILLDKINKMLSYCDETDFEIIKGIMKGIGREQTSQNLHIGISTYKYRVNKIYKRLGIESKPELLDLLKKYNIFNNS